MNNIAVECGCALDFPSINSVFLCIAVFSGRQDTWVKTVLDTPSPLWKCLAFFFKPKKRN